MRVSDEELILKTSSEFLNIDPETKAEAYIALSEKYAREMDEFLEKGDYVQASEKAWGAASQILKFGKSQLPCIKTSMRTGYRRRL